MTIHDFDMARWLLGEEPETVMAAASVLTDPAIGALGDFDSASVILTTATGRQAVISNSRRAAYGYDQRIEVLGAKGAVAAGNTHRANIVVADAGGFTRPPLLDFFMTRYTAAYTAEIAAFVEALRAGVPPPVGGEDGLRALLLAEAALRSVAARRAVRVDEIGG
jgi:myo-inositol 2-dehydrogenase/D-chiro-inositol 1-dehydrogenase